MHYVAAGEATQNLPSLIRTAQQEPVAITGQNREVEERQRPNFSFADFPSQSVDDLFGIGRQARTKFREMLGVPTR